MGEAGEEFVPGVDDRAKLNALAHSIAYDDSVVAIQSNCMTSVDERWWDLASVEQLSREYVETAVRYLELRGLIERHPERPELIDIRDVDEATR